MEFKIKVGELNKRIAIQKLGEIQYNDNGFPISNDDGFGDYKTVWASINNLFGQEFYSAKAINEENTVNFIIRYSKDLTDIDSKNYRIKWKNRVFNITFIDNVQYANKWIKIKAIETI